MYKNLAIFIKKEFNRLENKNHIEISLYITKHFKIFIFSIKIIYDL